MLYLQRNEGEIINIADDIEVKVLRISPNINDPKKLCVLIGIEAPKTVEIWRNEVYRARKRGVDKSERLSKCQQNDIEP